MKQLEYKFNSEQETIDFAVKISNIFLDNLDKYKLLPTILLYGEMGAGKTCFTRAFVRNLPDAHLAEVASPSFSYVNNYPTKPEVLHADLFRLDEDLIYLPEDIEDAFEMCELNKGINIIEWAERIPSKFLPKNRLDIIIKACNTDRQFLIKAHGDVALDIVNLL